MSDAPKTLNLVSMSRTHIWLVPLLLIGLVGYANAATIRGSAGNDTLRGTTKADRLFGARGNDVILSGAGNDRLDGGSGDDRLYGQPGSDRIIGGPGLDRLLGGAGNDVLLVRDGVRDFVWCGGGLDRVVADAVDAVARDCESTVAPAPLYRLSVSVSEGGAVLSSPGGIDCGSDCSEQFRAGTAVTLNSVPASGWKFSGWSGSCTGTASCVVFLDVSRSVRATFVPAPSPPPPPPPPPAQTFSLTATVTGAGRVTSSPGGIDCGSDCTEDYVSGTNVSLTAAPEGALGVFIAWAGACTGTGACTVGMDEDKTVIALFGP